MKRRKFLFLTLAGFSAVGVAYYSYDRFGKSLGSSVLIPQFLPKIMDSQTVEKIGQEYLTQNLNNAPAKEIKLMLTQSGVDNSISLNELNNLVLREFSKGNTETVQGWVLSKIELLQCALYVQKS